MGVALDVGDMGPGFTERFALGAAARAGAGAVHHPTLLRQAAGQLFQLLGCRPGIAAAAAPRGPKGNGQDHQRQKSWLHAYHPNW